MWKSDWAKTTLCRAKTPDFFGGDRTDYPDLSAKTTPAPLWRKLLKEKGGEGIGACHTPEVCLVQGSTSR